MPMRRSSACMANCGWPMAGAASRLASRRRSCVPGRLVEVGVEAGQHHRAVRQLRDGLDQRRGRRHRAGGAGRDHRAAACAASRLRFGRDQQVAPRGRLDPAALGEDRRPASRAIFRNRSVSCQYSSMLVRHQRRRARPTAPAAWSCRPSAAPARRRARAPRPDCWRPAARRRRGAHRRRRRPFARRAGPAAAGARARRARPADRARRRRSAASANTSSSSSMSPIGTMRGRIAASVAERVEEHVARQPAGAPRRQIDVAEASASGSPAPESPSTSVPSRSAPISVGRNGAEAGMVKTRGRATWSSCWTIVARVAD